MKVLIALCFVGLAFAQVPRPCMSPPQWESTEIREDYQRRFREFRKLHYDEANRRIREIEEIMEGTTREFHDRLYLYNENKNYSINLRTRMCTVSTLMRPFHYRGVHPEAKFDAIFNIGAVGVPGESLAVQAWSANETMGDFYTGLVTYPDCYPVQTIYYSQMGGFDHSEYVDLSIGISDLNVFVPPPECMQAEADMKL